MHSDRNADVHDADATTLEALLQKSHDIERSTSDSTGQDIQLSAMSDSPRPASIQADPSSQIVLPKPAKPVRDNAQLVSVFQRDFRFFLNYYTFLATRSISSRPFFSLLLLFCLILSIGRFHERDF